MILRLIHQFDIIFTWCW